MTNEAPGMRRAGNVLFAGGTTRSWAPQTTAPPQPGHDDGSGTSNSRSTGRVGARRCPWFFPPPLTPTLGLLCRLTLRERSGLTLASRRPSSKSFSNSAMRASRVVRTPVISATPLRDEQRLSASSASWRTLPRLYSERGRESEFPTVRTVPCQQEDPAIQVPYAG